MACMRTMGPSLRLRRYDLAEVAELAAERGADGFNRRNSKGLWLSLKKAADGLQGDLRAGALDDALPQVGGTVNVVRDNEPFLQRPFDRHGYLGSETS